VRSILPAHPLRLAQALMGFATPRFKILAYHSVGQQSRDPFEVTVVSFKDQLQVIEDQGLRVVSLAQGWQALMSGQILPGTLVLTFDDGFRSLQDFVFPLLADYTFPATVFLPFAYLGRPDSFSYASPRPEFEILSREEIMASISRGGESGLSYGSHTLSHADLTCVTQEALLTELVESRNQLIQLVGSGFTSLAYPFGLYDERVKLATVQAGYDCALCFGNIMSNSRYISPYEMKREKILNSTSLTEFKNLIRVKNDFPRKLRHDLKRLRLVWP